MLKKIAAFFISASMIFGSFSAGCVFADGNSVNDSSLSDEKIAAFPGAQGGGMYATGARGAALSGEQMEVYHVTTLNDNGEGSFREAVKGNNRIIVFDISGIIDLNSNVNISGENITILGQTAPGDGITFRSHNVKVSGENIILRYLRFRVGDKAADGVTDLTAMDGLEVVDNTQNVIIDHCSVSWGTDENLTAYAVKDVTIQNCIIAEALNRSVHDKGDHSYAAIWGGVNLTVHHNIIATHKSRNPKIGTSETTAMTAGYEDQDTVVDIRNNIIYNWGDKAGYGSENGAKTNIVNNVYKPGPATPSGKRARIFEYSTGNKYKTAWSGQIYANGNIIDVDSVDADKDDADKVNENNYQPELKTGVYPDGTCGADWKAEEHNLSAPINTYDYSEDTNGDSANDYFITTTSAENAYEYCLENAGARLPKFDIVDQRIIDNVKNRTAPETGTHGSSYLVDSPIDGVPESDKDKYDDRGYPKIVSETREADFDSDGDGIKDVWEDEMGLDNNNPYDSLNIGPEGYTWLEIYVEDAIENAGDDRGEISLNDDFSYTPSDGSCSISFNFNSDKAEKAELYANDNLLEEVSLENIESSQTFNFNMEPGESYITVKLINSDGSYKFSKTKIVYIYGESLTSSDFEIIGNENTAVSESGGSYYIYSKNGKTAGLGKKEISEDFTFIADSSEISNLTNGAQTGVLIKAENGKYIKVYKTCENYQIVIKADKDGDVSDVSGIDPYKADIMKIYKADDTIGIEIGESAAMLSEALSASYQTDFSNGKLEVYAYVSSAEETETISVFKSVRYVDSEQMTTPTIEITNIKENQQLNFDENIELKITPDSKAKVNEIHIYFKDSFLNSRYYDDGLSGEQEISIPAEFSEAAEGELKAVCFDENLGMGEYKVNVVISAYIDPWKTADIGAESSDVPSYVQGTDDYTYKIYGPDGNISGTNDKYAYMYQEFNDDMRIYYRSRVQSNKYFGIMLKDSLDADGISYYFGNEPNDSKTRDYILKVREEKGGEYQSIDKVCASEDDVSGNTAYIIAEKEGNKLRIYKTSGGNADLYKTKTLLAETEVELGESYYMGFASTKEISSETEWISDAGWVAIENIDKNNEESYKWNMNYGLDWYWQIQNKTVLAPDWTDESIGGNATGKMVIAPDSNYYNSFIMREYTINQGTAESGFDIFITGEKPSIEFYLQTAINNAYRVAFNSDGTISFGDETAEGGYSASSWIKVVISSLIGEDTAKISVYDSDGSLIAQKDDVSASEFTTVNNVQTKNSISQGFFIRPLEGGQGQYYLDNMYVLLNAKTSLEDAILAAEKLDKSEYTKATWKVLSQELDIAKEILESESAGFDEIFSAAENIFDAIDALEPINGEAVGETKFWDFSNQEFADIATSGEIPAGTYNFDELSMILTSKTTRDSSGKLFDDGTNLGTRIKMGKQHFKINTSGKADIVVYALSASSAERNLVITDGTNTEKYLLSGTPKAAVYNYAGPGPAVIDIYGEEGLNYYGIKYTPYIVIDNTSAKIKDYDKTTGAAEIYTGVKGLENAVLCLVVTDDSGKVVEFKKQEVEITAENTDCQEVNIGTPSNEGTAKLLLWDSLDTMKPISGVYEIE